MRRNYAAAALVVLAAGAACWAALAWGQPAPGRLPEANVPAPGPSPRPEGPVPPPQPPSDDLNVATPGPQAMPSLFPPPTAPLAKPHVPGPDAVLPVGHTGPAAAPAPERPAAPPEAPPAGKQEPAVSLEWVGPPAARLGQPLHYTLLVRNTGAAAVEDVHVRVRLPGGLTAATTETPAASADAAVLNWELGTLSPRQEKPLRLKLVAESKGDLTPQAWVSFTATATAVVRVREPKLVVKAAAPERLRLGEQGSLTLTVSNAGDGPADAVRLHATLSEGLENARGGRADYEIGPLGAGESRNVTLLCVPRAAGAQRCEVAAEADGGLSAHDQAAVTVVTPRLEVQASGPGLRYLERKALYTFKVSNPGDAPAANVSVADAVPEGFKVLAATHGGRYDPQVRTVSWFLGDVAPGEAREVQLEVQAVGLGAFRHKASASAAHGLHAESELATRVEGLSALQLEVRDTEDPVEVSGETTYEVRLLNSGSKTETNVRLSALLPEKLAFQSARGPTTCRADGATLLFEPLASLAPRAEVTFRVTVKALEAGTASFKVQVTSADIPDPVVKVETTRVYSDSSQ
jgi:uncharacterized repeat protein (TIGR01451 family)